MRIKGNRLLVQPKEAESKIGKFSIPDGSREKPNIGTVIAIGNGVKDGEYAINDTVMYPKAEGVEISVDGKEYLIIQEQKVYMVL